MSNIKTTKIQICSSEHRSKSISISISLPDGDFAFRNEGVPSSTTIGAEGTSFELFTDFEIELVIRPKRRGDKRKAIDTEETIDAEESIESNMEMAELDDSQAEAVTTLTEHTSVDYSISNSVVASELQLFSYGKLTDTIKNCYLNKKSKTKYLLRPHGVSPILHGDSAPIGFLSSLTPGEQDAVYDCENGLIPQLCPFYCLRRKYFKESKDGDNEKKIKNRNNVERLLDGYCVDPNCNYKFLIARVPDAMLMYEAVDTRHTNHNTFSEKRGELSLSLAQKEYCMKNKSPKLGPLGLLQSMKDNGDIRFSAAQLDPENEKRFLKMICNFLYDRKAKQQKFTNKEWTDQCKTDINGEDDNNVEDDVCSIECNS